MTEEKPVGAMPRNECQWHREQMNGRLLALERDMGTVKSDLGTVKTDLGTVKTDLAAVKTAVATITSTLSTMGKVSDRLLDYGIWTFRIIVAVLVLVAAGRGIDLTSFLGGL